MLEVGKKAPAFSLSANNGKKIALKDFKDEKNIVLFFYPKDSTPGCTTEACDFRDNLQRIQKTDTVVLGVSKDSVASHEKFITKQELNFDLLSDEDGAICEKYGVWQEKKLYGKVYMGIVRTTFIIGKDG